VIDRIKEEHEMAVSTIALPTQRSRTTFDVAAPLATLTRRRFALSARTPREIIVPLINPVLFALVIAPALNKVLGGFRSGIDYVSFVAIGTIGLLIPINTMFAGLGVIVDRDSGAQRGLVAAPIQRGLVVMGNLTVALTTTCFQVAALIAFALLRGAHFAGTVSGITWFTATTVLFAIGSYGVAETMANRIPRQEEYIGAVPATAILPWFFAGSLFPISALPRGLAAFARVLPLTHALALMRYGLGVDRLGRGLHDIWGLSNVTAMASLSLAVVALFAAVFTVLAVRVFSRSALR
jgi:ABC-2 type transport system permease protein